jgi:hypothetical protein
VEIVAVVGDLRHEGSIALRGRAVHAVRPTDVRVDDLRCAHGGRCGGRRAKLKRQIWAIDPLQTFYQTSTMDALVSATVARAVSAPP